MKKDGFFVCLFPVSDEIIRNWLKDLCSYFANLEKKSQILNLSDSKYFDGIPNLYYHSHCLSPPLICVLPPSFPLSFPFFHLLPHLYTIFYLIVLCCSLLFNLPVLVIANM